MAGAPEWKVYRDGEYIAACKHAEDAAALVALSGGDVRHGHRKADIVWREGAEAFSAGESYDGAARIMVQRVEERWTAARSRQASRGAR